jgi:hypothetical protein
VSEEISAEELAEVLVCLARVILLIRKMGWVDDEGVLLQLEDDLSELHQQIR